MWPCGVYDDSCVPIIHTSTRSHVRTFAHSHIYSRRLRRSRNCVCLVCLGGPLVGGGRPVQTGASADQKTSSSSESLRVDSAAPCRHPPQHGMIDMVCPTWRVQHGRGARASCCSMGMGRTRGGEREVERERRRERGGERERWRERGGERGGEREVERGGAVELYDLWLMTDDWRSRRLVEC